MNTAANSVSLFNRRESEVRGYCRQWPVVFESSQGHIMTDESGRDYIDFFAGAGALNYGHNPEPLKNRLLEYISSNGILHSLDMHTSAKRAFLQAFERKILDPRNMDYKIMFPGPTGTNCVESALKLARKVTGRHNIVSFTNGFHGMTLGSLALTGNSGKRAGAGVPLSHVSRMPFCDYLGSEADTIFALERFLEDGSSGMDLPAAFILETVQAEGGVNVASRQWMQDLAALARRYDVLLIIDDIQVGCGRTGGFFSFEPFDIEPDIICLSKSLSGYGLPFAVTLIRPEHDQFSPGEHNGTFRGHNAAFVTATAAIDEYWSDGTLSAEITVKAKLIRDTLLDIASQYDAEVRGRGMIQGIQFADPQLAGKISAAAFDRGLIIETAGPDEEVLKLLPSLTISPEGLQEGLDILEACVTASAGGVMVESSR